MNDLTEKMLHAILFVVLLAAPTSAFAQELAEESAPQEQQAESLTLSTAAQRGAAVASVLDQPRDTPAQELKAIFTLLDLGEDEVAQLLWKDFAPEMQDQTKSELVKQFGVARFLFLARRGESGGLTGAREFAESCLTTAAKLGRDPEQLAKMIADLENEAIDVRRAARSDLSVAGTDGAEACLEALASAPEGDAGELLRTELLLTLAKMRPIAEPLLLSSLTDGAGQFRRDVVELTGYLQLTDAVPWLAAIAAGAESDASVVAAAGAALQKMGLSAPASADARAVVLSELQRIQSQTHPPETDRWWTYEPEQKQLTEREVTAKQHQTLATARLARVLGDLPDATVGDRRLELIYAYQVSQVLDLPLSDEDQQLAKTLDVAQLSETLHEALTNQHTFAAIACAELLGTRADDAALSSTAGQPSPLAAALAHPSRQVRFAALEAIMKIAPQRSFAGASHVPKTLWEFASGAGDPQAIAASSIVGGASQWAGELRGRGYDATPVTTGRQTLLAALNSPRLELIFLDSDIGRPTLREVVFGLRSNPQLTQTPIAVLCSLDNLARAERIAEGDQWLIATPRPHTADSIDAVLEDLSELGALNQTADRRTEQAVAALGWLAELLEKGHPYDELLRDAEKINKTAYDPLLTEPSLKVLTVLGTAGSQRLLLDIASSATQSIETRRAAVAAFAASIERFGKQLTSEEILRQYDRYNVSETADRETQEVLGELLDVLEKMTHDEVKLYQ